jgi:ADP-heptose:LPS heptosyltransferase
VLASKSVRRAAPRAAPPPLDGPIERIAVFRALVLGDLLCAVPVLRAVRRAFAQARITLVGLPWARDWVEHVDCVDDFIAFPGHPELPERACDVAAWPAFLAEVQARRFDLALQLHGSGATVNGLVALFGARRTAGFVNDAAWRPDADAPWYAPWPERGHEVERLLALTDWLGLPRDGTQLEFPVRDVDRAALREVWPDAARARPYAVVHAGAQLPSRRWPLERFAQVADGLVERGCTVVLTGTADERERVARLSAAIRHPCVNLAGRTSLWTLGALVEGAAHLVCNDTGVSHVAAALGTPSVVISSGGDALRWAPFDRSRHTVLWQPMACRPCAHAVCPIGHDCAHAIGVDEVLQALDAQRQPPEGAPVVAAARVAPPAHAAAAAPVRRETA